MVRRRARHLDARDQGARLAEAGIKFGRKRKLSDYQRAEAANRRAAGETLAAIAKSGGMFGPQLSSDHDVERAVRGGLNEPELVRRHCLSFGIWQALQAVHLGAAARAAKSLRLRRRTIGRYGAATLLKVEIERASEGLPIGPGGYDEEDRYCSRMQLFGHDTVLEVNRDVTEAKALIKARKQFEHANLAGVPKQKILHDELAFTSRQRSATGTAGWPAIDGFRTGFDFDDLIKRIAVRTVKSRPASRHRRPHTDVLDCWR